MNDKEMAVFDKFEKYLKLNDPGDLREFRKLKNNYIKGKLISLYADWETNIKESIYLFYREMEEYYSDDDFLQKYLTRALQNNYTKNMVIDSIDRGNIKVHKDILIFSNNLNFKELRELFNILEIDFNCFLKFLDERLLHLDFLIEQMEEVAIYPLYLSKEPEYSSISKKVEGYVNNLVQKRNQIAHSFALDEIYSMLQVNYIYEFQSYLIDTIKEYFELIKVQRYYLKNSNLTYQRKNFKEKTIVDIYFENNTKGTPLLLGINEEILINKDDVLFLLKDGKIAKGLVVEDGKIHSDEGTTLKIDTNLKIKKRDLKKVKILI